MTAPKPQTDSASAQLDQRLTKALGHPLRERILQSLSGAVASPAELSRALDEPLGNVAYHVKVLLECEAIELVRTAPVRGAVEHFYTAAARSAHLSRTELVLDEEAFARLAKEIEKLAARARRLEEETAARGAKLSTAERRRRKTHHAELAMAFFEAGR